MTKHFFDSHDRLWKVVNPVGNSTVFEYNYMDERLSAETREMDDSLKPVNKASWQYDEKGRCVKETAHLFNASYIETETLDSEYFFDRYDLLRRTVSPRAYEEARDYDKFMRLWHVNGADGTITTYDYDQASNVERVQRSSWNQAAGVAEMFWTRFEYDPMNRLRKTITFRPSAEPELTTSYYYNFRDDICGVKDPAGRTTERVFDVFGRMITERQELDGTTGLENARKNVYDGNGRLTQMKNAYEKTTVYGFDEQNRLRTVTYPDNNRKTFDYDAAGNLEWITWTRRVDNADVPFRKVKHEYDKAGRLIRKNAEIGESGSETTFGYDALDRTTLARRTWAGVYTSEVSFVYDS
ncbi:MAG: hypothetical protein L0213_02595, partial [Candidatus Dadabacteria bacterium]|nr:hypothetical protein [Candidatus Dadabacteria bacterium]